jgi:hypothetical protein
MGREIRMEYGSNMAYEVVPPVAVVRNGYTTSTYCSGLMKQLAAYV